MRPMAKNDPFIHKPYTLCVRCVLRGEFLQCTHDSLVFIDNWERFHGFVQAFRAFLKDSNLALLYYRRSWKRSQ